LSTRLVGLFKVGWVLLLNGDGCFFGETPKCKDKGRNLNIHPKKRTKTSILGVQDVYFPGCWAFGAECWMVFGILYLQKLLMGYVLKVLFVEIYAHYK